MKGNLLNLLGTTGDLSEETIFLRILAGFVLGCFIYLSYMISHEGSVYSRKFNISLVILTLITTTVMIVIGNNIALSLGMVGALSIVRFRTVIKDSRDTVYIFWCIVVGICCGAGDYKVATIGSAFIFATILVFGRIKSDNRMLLIIRVARPDSEKVEALIFQYYKAKASMRAKNTGRDSVEYIYELSRKRLEEGRNRQTDITDEIYLIEGLEYFNIVAQNDEISS